MTQKLPEPIATDPRRLRVLQNEIASEADHERWERARPVRSQTENMLRVPKSVRAERAAFANEVFEEIGEIDRPKTRADCVDGERPCPFASCKYHLAVDVNSEDTDEGRPRSIKINFPDLDVADMSATCALDIADEGGATLEQVAEVINVTRERVRQIENIALRRVQKRAGALKEWAEGALRTDPAGGHMDGGPTKKVKVGHLGRTSASEESPHEEEPSEPEADGTQRAIWDLYELETPQRTSAACAAMYRAYMSGSTAHGFVKVDPKMAASLEKTERYLATRKSSANAIVPEPESVAPVALIVAPEPVPTPPRLGFDDASIGDDPIEPSNAIKPIVTVITEKVRMTKTSKVEDIFNAIESGAADTATTIAAHLRLTKPNTHYHLTNLVGSGRIEVASETTSGSKHYRVVNGAKSGSTSPRHVTALARRERHVEVPSVTLDDVSGSTKAGAARYTVRIGEMAVDCQNAVDVYDLAVAMNQTRR